MRSIRNLTFFAVFVSSLTGCGGGNSGITNNDSTGASSGGTAGPGAGIATVTLKWAAPTSRADASPVSLSEISGYRLYYGKTATNTPNFITINNGTATQYTISLPAGSYYFRISAIDTGGHEGLRSAANQKTI
jgi:hypothetical protein